MITDQRRNELVKLAIALADSLGSFRTPGSSDPVDPARLAEVQRFVKVNGTADLRELLKQLPSSYLQKASRSAGPQLEEIKRQVSPLARDISDPDELAYLLAWARRLMSVNEKVGPYHSPEDRAKGSRGGRDPRGPRTRGGHGRR